MCASALLPGASPAVFQILLPPIRFFFPPSMTIHPCHPCHGLHRGGSWVHRLNFQRLTSPAGHARQKDPCVWLVRLSHRCQGVDGSEGSLLNRLRSAFRLECVGETRSSQRRDVHARSEKHARTVHGQRSAPVRACACPPRAHLSSIHTSRFRTSLAYSASLRSFCRTSRSAYKAVMT